MNRKKTNEKRSSQCIVCGKRLSYQTAMGGIKWHASHVVDEGLYCEECFNKNHRGKASRKSRT